MRALNNFGSLSLSKNLTKVRKKALWAFFAQNKSVLLYGLLLKVLMLLSACGDNTQNVSVPIPKESNNPEELRVYIESQIQNEDLSLFSTSFENICPKYSSLEAELQKHAFSGFALSIISAESDFNSFATYYEKTMGYHSVGLFSLSYADAKVYKCSFSELRDRDLERQEKSIFQTDLQVDCFLRITRSLTQESQKFPYLRELALNDKKAKGKAEALTTTQKLSAYWSVLRDSNKKGEKSFALAKKRYLPSECF